MEDGNSPKVFQTKKQPQYFAEFRDTHPDARWSEYLDFCLNTFPQFDDSGELQYIIEGGLAIKIWHQERKEPGDFDIIDLKGGLREKMGLNTRFNSVTVNEWAESRKLDSFIAEKALREGVKVVGVNGRGVAILNQSTLAAIKTLPYMDRPMRESDKVDLEILGFSTEAARQEAVKFR